MNSTTKNLGTVAPDREPVLAGIGLDAAGGEDGFGPLSFGQQRLWFLDQLHPNNSVYNVHRVLRLAGSLDPAALESALNIIALRHEVLRTRFISLDGEAAQVIDEEPGIRLEQQDLTHAPKLGRQAEVEQRISAEVNRPFHLGSDRLLRACLLRIGPDEHFLVLVAHHIVCDDWSFDILFRELTVCYRDLVTRRPISLPELPIQYADYAAWQRDWLQGRVFERQLGFWKEQLHGNPAGVELASDRPRGSTIAFSGGVRWLALGNQLSDGLKQLAQTQGATVYMVLLAAFNALLYRYTWQDDLVVGTPIAGRTRMETQDLIGFFVNTLPLRTRVSGDRSFLQLLAQVRETALAAYSHQDLPFDQLVEALHPERALNNVPFVKVMFLTQQGGSGRLEWPGLEVEVLTWGMDTAKFDLLLGVTLNDGGFVARAEYNAELFNPETMTRFLEHYRHVLEGVVAQPKQTVSELPLLSAAERHQVLVEWNQTWTDYPRHSCVHELFEEQVAARPQQVALLFGKCGLTYGELNARANQLAHFLRAAGVRRGDTAALCAERSLEMIIGLLGILKVGAAYASLEPGAPQARLAQILSDLKPAVLLTQHHLLRALPQDTGQGPGLTGLGPVCLDTGWERIARESRGNLCCDTDPEDLAYICFTSGSTGRPKGVCVPHRAVVRLVKNTNFASFAPDQVFLQLAPISFDASTFEIWGSLLNGARLTVLPPQVPSLSELGDAIQQHQVTTAWFTSGFFNQIVEEKPEILRSLRQILTGGDVLSPVHIKKALSFAGSGRLINGYGPTENTTFTACYAIPPSFSGEHSIPIGRPIANTQGYVLDANLQPVPIGVPGELYTGGDGLAAGYLNDPRLTAEKFIPNPFEPGSRLYRTGDLVRWLVDGNLEFLGRLDNQVKVRGFRVEVGEVESVLLQHPGVSQCAVTARTDAAGVKQLVAYVVSAGQPAPTAEQYQAFLRQHLPEYMVPSAFVALQELPLSANGKLDRRALPAPEISALPKGAHTPPRDEVERQLQQVWEAVLNVRPIGVQDHFFALGGHSLLAVRLVARIEKLLGKQLTVATVFQHPTLEKMAALLRGDSHAGPGSSIVEIQPQGTKPPLFLVHGAGGGMFWGYSNLARHLGPDQPVLAFKSRGLDGLEELETVEKLAEAYLVDLRRERPHGPYYLGGYCFGGLIAFEMARRLHAAGETIGLLAFINTSPPNSHYTQFRWTPVSACRFLKNFGLRTYFSVRSHPEKLAGFFKWKGRSLTRRLQSLVPVSHAEPLDGKFSPDEWIDLSDYPEDQRRIWRTHLQALATYHPQPYPGKVTLFRSPVHILYCSYDPLYGWGQLALGGVEVKVIPGAHETIMEEPRVRRLAAELRTCLAADQSGVANT